MIAVVGTSQVFAETIPVSPTPPELTISGPGECECVCVWLFTSVDILVPGVLWKITNVYVWFNELTINL